MSTREDSRRWSRGCWILLVAISVVAGWIAGRCSAARAPTADPPPRAPRTPDPWDWRPDEEPEGRRIQLVARPKRPPAETLPLLLSGPSEGQWRLAKPVEQLDQLRLELQLAPRGIPRWRFVGSSTLAAKRDGTWIEFIQGKADQVLKFKVECQMDETLEVRVTPHFQLAPQGAVMKLTEQTRWQADQITTLAQLRVERQLAWLATASKGKSSGKGKPAGPPPAVKLMLHSQQAVLKVARQRLDRLQELRQKLEGTVELEVRAVLGEEGTNVPLEKTSPDRPSSPL